MTADPVSETVHRFEDLWRVDLPDGEVDGLMIDHFVVEPGVESVRLLLEGRPVRTGVTYTRLFDRRTGTLWMTDTQAEARDHYGAFFQAKHLGAKRVLVNGLGIGMLVHALLTLDTIGQIDVVESDQRCIDLVAPHYPERVTVYHDDARAIEWPTGTRWDVAWHDIWPNITSENLPEMHRLHRKYGRRVAWQGSWARDLCERRRRYEGTHQW